MFDGAMILGLLNASVIASERRWDVRGRTLAAAKKVLIKSGDS